MANILGSRAALRGETRRQQSKFEVYLRLTQLRNRLKTGLMAAVSTCSGRLYRIDQPAVTGNARLFSSAVSRQMPRSLRIQSTAAMFELTVNHRLVTVLR
jgi:hypothetical protein